MDPISYIHLFQRNQYNIFFIIRLKYKKEERISLKYLKKTSLVIFTILLIALIFNYENSLYPMLIYLG